MRVYNELCDVGNLYPVTNSYSALNKKHMLSFKKISAKLVAVDNSEINSWNISILSFLFSYKPTDIYNLDKTGLFFICLQPDKALRFHLENCSNKN